MNKDDWRVESKDIKQLCLNCKGTFKEHYNSPIAFRDGICQECYGRGYLTKKIFYPKDIETLRQKLIDDFIMYAKKHHIICTIEFYEIINKRFGVKE